ncbi:MAG: glycosyltransferase family 9 protein, partial [Methylophaga sp.]|nr:glycosyltransferase family 9 protein [Methylophaga sp.]
LPELDFELTGKYLIFVQNASWLSKMWPVKHWQKLVLMAREAGFSVLLPSGNDAEYQRAKKIALVDEVAHALPRMSLNNMAALMHYATGAVCSDTGLAHLAAVAGIPALTIYGATDTALIGTYGKNQQHLVSDFSCAPCYKRSCLLKESDDGKPVCMQEMLPETVWHEFQGLLPKNNLDLKRLSFQTSEGLGG